LGAGLSALIERGFLKHTDADQWEWITAGTMSLILIMAGINLLFESFASKPQLTKSK
jgi:hypothetical protein